MSQVQYLKTWVVQLQNFANIMDVRGANQLITLIRSIKVIGFEFVGYFLRVPPEEPTRHRLKKEGSNSNRAGQC